MATKTISITEDAYRRLASLRKHNESFSEIIVSVTGKRKLSELYGLLAGKKGEEFEKAILESRKKHKEMSKRRMEKILKQWER